MKIITNTKMSGKLCYVQIKDLLFLAKYTGNKRLMQDYINAINSGKGDNEFIKVNGDSYIRAFELCDYIIDFSEYSKRDIGVNYLSNMIKTKVYAMPKDEMAKEGLDYQIDGIRDIIAYKRGDLDYKIPLVADGRIEYVSNNLIFNSTIVNGCFALKTLDGTDISECKYEEFLKASVDRMYKTIYPDVESRDYSTFVSGKTLVVSIHKVDVKKKKNVVGKILAKIKKED